MIGFDRVCHQADPGEALEHFLNFVAQVWIVDQDAATSLSDDMRIAVAIVT
jgi:hypothetical protein